MKIPLIVFPVLATGAAIGWLAPGSGGFGDDPAVLSAGGRPEAAALSAREQWLAGEEALQHGPDGHFYADVAVDGQNVQMLVDTGASVVALTGADAEAIGLSWSEGEVAPVARGASGPVLGVRVRLERVAVGGLEAEGVEAIIVPEGLGISLLGQSFLSTVRRVEVRGEVMVLGG